MKAIVFALCLAASMSMAQGSLAELDKAQQQMGAKKYADALKSLEAALKKPALDRDNYLNILELKGLAEAQLGKAALSEATFKQLLSLDSKRSLVGKYSGAPMVAIGAAQTYVTNNGSLEVVAGDPISENGMVKQLNVSVRNDGLAMGKSLRFHVKSDTGVWKPSDVTLVNSAGSTAVSGAVVEYWVELFNDKGAQLMLLGSPVKPAKAIALEVVPVKVVAKETVATAIVDVPKAQVKLDAPVEKKIEEAQIVVEDASKSSSIVRPIGYGLMAAGVVAAGVGVYFGVTSSGMRETIKTDLAAGKTPTSELYARDQQAISNATVANILFATGGALAVTGGILWFVGGSDEPAQVAVMPTLGGMSVSGKF